jgi:hypothetical protein
MFLCQRNTTDLKETHKECFLNYRICNRNRKAAVATGIGLAGHNNLEMGIKPEKD